MKKILSLLLIFSLFFSAFGFFVYAAENSFIVQAPDSVDKAGEEITVTVSVSAPGGFAGVQFMLEYDSDVLECVGIDIDGNLKDCITMNNPDFPSAAYVMVANAETIGTASDVASIKFVSKKSGVPGFNLTKNKICDEEGSVLPSGVKGVVSSPEPKKDENILNRYTYDDKAEAAASDFTDTAGHWSADFVKRAAQLGIFKGYSDGSFKPDSPVTRAQFVTVLYRMAKSPEIGFEAPFDDISNLSSEFKKAIAWAYSNGYVNGKGAGRFDPSGIITRQEAMKILFALSGAASGPEMMFEEIYAQSFPDSGEIASWAKKPMYWAYYNGLISGTSNGRLSPKSSASRGQLAKILINYLEKGL